MEQIWGRAMRRVFGVLTMVMAVSATAEGLHAEGQAGWRAGTGLDLLVEVGGSDYGTAVPNAGAITPQGTRAITSGIRSGIRACQRARDPQLNVDCLAYEFWLTAQILPNTGDYGEARAALLDAADKLQALAERNAAKDRPRVGMILAGRASQREITPVANPARVAAAAAAIVDETTLVLLRSASGSSARRTAFEQVAAVVGSSKVLLRAS